MSTRVIRVGSLAAFRAEVPPPATLRLVLLDIWDVRSAGKYRIPSKDFRLSLMSDEPGARAVWLTHTQHVLWAPDGNEPWDARGKEIVDGMEAMRRIVHAHLTRLGYDVRDGDLALPRGMLPVNGRFECAAWEKRDGHYHVVPAPDLSPADLARGALEAALAMVARDCSPADGEDGRADCPTAVLRRAIAELQPDPVP